MKKHPAVIIFIIILLFTVPACCPCASATPETVESTQEVAQTPITITIESGNAEDSFPDTIFHNGIVLTMEQNQPRAEAIAILDDEIYAVGSSEGVLALSGPETNLIDLGGKTLLPGFIDSHTHWIGDNELNNYRNVDETIRYVIENGWTSINEMFVSPERLEELLLFDQEERLHVRVNAYLPINYLDQRFGRPYLQYSPLEILSPRVRVAGVKFFTDNDWGHIINWEQSEFNEEVQAAHQAGWQVAIHTFSIQGHSMVLEALELALQGEDNSAYRHRIEHVIAITDEQLAEIQQQGYIASIQLNFPGNIPQADPTFYDKVPEEDFPLFTRWEDIYQAGITIAGGTDWPWFSNDTFIERGGAPAGSPLRLLYKAATHTDTNNRIPDDWMRSQFLSVEAALQSLTINGAYATFEEDVKGSLKPGKWADIVILSDNPLTVPIEKLIEIEVLMTMIGGNVEHCAEGAAALCGQASEGAEKSIEPTLESTSEDVIVTQPGSAIEIAVQGPVTGQLSDFYPHMWNAAQMAVEDYGLVLGGFPVTLVQIDDRCEQAASVIAAEQLIMGHPQVVGVIGPFCSSAAMGSLPVYQQGNLVSISGSATQDDLSTLFGAGGFNRINLNDGQLRDLGVSEDFIDVLASVQDFYTRYESQYSPLPAEIKPLMAYTYDAVHVLLNAIEDTANMGEYGIRVELSALAEAVRSMHDFTGITGLITFDEDGDRIPAELSHEPYSYLADF